MHEKRYTIRHHSLLSPFSTNNSKDSAIRLDTSISPIGVGVPILVFHYTVQTEPNTVTCWINTQPHLVNQNWYMNSVFTSGNSSSRPVTTVSIRIYWVPSPRHMSMKKNSTLQSCGTAGIMDTASVNVINAVPVEPLKQSECLLYGKVIIILFEVQMSGYWYE